ncbi:transporter substrate-binding protein [Paraflavisolibacter sp. H34]|uniref:transporter substrate-binding protein n=1 Tax=Huijunlia imazamoxiresistens TaxID=3127457 RepID=UPI003018CD56
MTLLLPLLRYRPVFRTLVLLPLLGSCGLFDPAPRPSVKDREKVGIVCSLSGVDAVSEASLKDAALMAIEQINDDGGLLGKKIEPVWEDGQSQVSGHVSRTAELLKAARPTALFGLWDERSVKGIAPFLRMYPTLAFNMEAPENDYGLKNMVFLGATTGQQALPAVRYLLGRKTGAFNRFYLLGNDEPYAHHMIRAIREQLLRQKVPPQHIKERYLPAEAADFSQTVTEIKQFSAGRACVFNMLRGESNLSFFREFAGQGLSAAYCPVLSFTASEEEFRHLDTEFFAGHLAAKGYFQSSEADKNIRFVSDFKLYCAINELPGGIDRVTNDGICWMYTAIQLWRKAVEKAGTFDPEKVRGALAGLELDSPAGAVQMGADGLSLRKKALIGESNPDGQFTVVWQSDSLLSPAPAGK